MPRLSFQRTGGINKERLLPVQKIIGPKIVGTVKTLGLAVSTILSRRDIIF